VVPEERWFPRSCPEHGRGRCATWAGLGVVTNRITRREGEPTTRYTAT
jgi:hypothetical protein